MARSVVLGATTLTTGTVAHVSGQGLLPSPWIMAALLVWTVAMVAPFTTSRLTAPTLVLLTVLGQAVSHSLLSLLAGHAGHAGGASASGGSLLAHQWQHITAQSPLMLGTHVLGAVAVGLLLAHEEHNLWHFVDLLAELSRPTSVVLLGRTDRAAARLHALLGLAEQTRRSCLTAGVTTLAPQPDLLGSTIARRGPPVLLPH